MQARTPLSNTISAFSLITAMLIEELEKSGAVTRKQFATRLRQTADEAEKTAPDDLKSDARLDLQIARHLAELLHGDDPQEPPKGWTPVVIDGGSMNNPPPIRS
jgi:hypothetical protein